MSLSRTSSESKRTSSTLPKILQGVGLEANGSKNFPITIPPCDHDRGKIRLIYKAQSVNFSMGKEYMFFAKENLHLCPLLFAVFPQMLRVSHSLELDLFPCTQDDNL